MNSIMLVMVILLALALAVVAYIALRNRIAFFIGVRNIPRRRAQTILIILGLMLSTLIISAAFTTGDTISSTMTAETYNVLGHVDETVLIGEDLDEGTNMNTFVSRQPISQSLATDIEQGLQGDKEVDGVMAVISEPVVALDSNTQQSEPLVVVVGVDASRLQAFPDIVDRKGHPINMAALAENEILVNESLADELSAKPGDTVVVFRQNQPYSFQIAGIVKDRLLTGATPYRRLGMVTRLDVLQEKFGREGQADFVAISNKGGVHDSLKYSDNVTAKIQNLLQGKSYNIDPTKAEGVKDAEDAGSFMVTIFVVLGLFSIAAGILLIFMIFVMLAAERKSEMGISRALGMKRGHLVQMFLAEGMGYNLVAAMVGVALGVVVSLAMTRIMAMLLSEFKITISFHVSWRSMIVSYALGVVLTFITVAFASWRVSALNIVRAIRDLPEPHVARAGRRALYLGIAGILLGILITRAGLTGDSMFSFAMGMTMVILGLGFVLRYKGLKERFVFTLMGLALLALWVLGAGGYLEGMTGKLESGMEMFFLSGLVMVMAATFIIVYNADLLLRLLERLGGRMSRILPAVKTAVAYPLATKFRTGMTMAMISLVVFALVAQSTMYASFDHVALSTEARGGWDVMVTENPGNPLGDLRETLKGAPGVDTSKFEAVGKVEPVISRSITLRQGTDDKFASYSVNAVDNGFITQNRISFQSRATGYESDSAVWEAMASDPSLAVIDAASLGGFGHGMGGNDFTLKGVKEGDRTFAPITIEMLDELSGQRKEVTLVGIISTKYSASFSGMYTSEQTVRDVTGQDRPDFAIHLIRLAPGENAKDIAKAIEADLMTQGAQAKSIKAEMEKQMRISRGFIWLLQGFMGLGLLVGTAAVGVIAFRTVVERRKQIGMLRAIGYQRNTISLSFMLESSFVTLLGIISGVALALLLAFLILNSSDNKAIGMDTFVIPWWEIILIAVFAYGSSLLMSFIPSRRAASLTIAEALRYE
jgi:putative ABC transport system permease protein